MFKVITLCLVASVTIAKHHHHSPHAKQAKCPTNVPIQKDFDLSQYTGTWFSLSRISGAPFENGNCGQSRYNLVDAKTG